MTTQVSCHACDSLNFVPVLLACNGEIELRRCDQCAFVYLASWQRSLAAHHELYSYYATVGVEERTRRYTPTNRRRQAMLLDALSRYAPGRRLLDVGCGDGQLVQTAIRENWNAEGIELSKEAVGLCRQHGLPVVQVDFFDESLSARRFDVVVMSELLEHVPKPWRFLQRAETLLAPGGVLYLTTPNFGSLSRRLLEERWPVIHPEHIGYLERATLRCMVREHTRLVEIRTDANNLSPSALFTWLAGRTIAGADEPPNDAPPHDPARRADQRLRRVLNRHPLLSTAKNAINHMVSRAGLGDTLVAWLQKPQA